MTRKASGSKHRAGSGNPSTSVQIFFTGLAAHVKDQNRNAPTTLLIDDQKMPMHDLTVCVDGANEQGPSVLSPGRYDIFWISGNQTMNGVTYPAGGIYNASAGTLVMPESFDWVQKMSVLGGQSIDQAHVQPNPPNPKLVKAQVALPPEGTMQTSDLVSWWTPDDVALMAWRDAGKSVVVTPMAEGVVFLTERDWVDSSSPATIKIVHTSWPPKPSPDVWTLTPADPSKAIRVRFENLMKNPPKAPAGQRRLPVASHMDICYDLLSGGRPGYCPIPVFSGVIPNFTQTQSPRNPGRCPSMKKTILSTFDPPICAQPDD